MQYQINALKSFPKIIGIGRNYQQNFQGVSERETPLIFMKPWSFIAYNPKQIALSSLKAHRIDF